MDITNGPFTTPRNTPFPFQTDDFPMFPTADRHTYNAVITNLRQQYQQQIDKLKATGGSKPQYDLAVSQLTGQYNNQLDAINSEWQATVTRHTTTPQQ